MLRAPCPLKGSHDVDSLRGVAYESQLVENLGF